MAATLAPNQGFADSPPPTGMVAYDPCGGIPDGGNKQTIQNYCNAAKAADEAGSTHKKVALVWSAVAVVCTAECAAAMSGGMFFGMPYNGIVCPIAGLSGTLLEMHFNSKLKDDLKNLQQAFLKPDGLRHQRFFAAGHAPYLNQSYKNGVALSKEDVFKMALGLPDPSVGRSLLKQDLASTIRMKKPARQRVLLAATGTFVRTDHGPGSMPSTGAFNDAAGNTVYRYNNGVWTDVNGARVSAPMDLGQQPYEFGKAVPIQDSVPQGSVTGDYGEIIKPAPAADGAPAPAADAAPVPAADAAPPGGTVAADAPVAPQGNGGPLGPELPETNELPELGKSTSVAEGGGDAAAGGGSQAATAAGPGAFETAMVCAAAAMTIYKTYTNFKAIDKDKATAKENRDSAHRLRQSALNRSPIEKFSDLFAGLLRKLDSISWLQSAVAAVGEAAVAFVSPFSAQSCNDGPGGLLSCARKADPSIPLGVVSPLFVERFEKISKHALREYVLQQEIASPAQALRQGLGPSVNPKGINHLGVALSNFESELPQLMASIEPQLEQMKANPVAVDSSRLDIKAMQQRLMALQKPSSFADLANSAVSPRTVVQPQRQPASEISQSPQNLFELVSARYRKCASRVVQLEPASPYNRYTQGLKSK